MEERNKSRLKTQFAMVFIEDLPCESTVSESQDMRKRVNRYAFPIGEEMNQSMHGA